MIKVGILEAASAHGAELVRILLHHPDVELAWAQSSVAQGPLSAFVRGISGDTDLQFGRLALAPVDVIINCSSVPVAPEFLDATAVSPEDVRVIEMGAYEPDGDCVYGLCELNRKALVRGARRACCISPLSMAVELALLPLAKHLLLNAPVSVAAAIGVGATRAISHRGMGHIPECEEIVSVLRTVQSSFAQPLDIVEMRCGGADGMMAVVSMQCPVSIGELRPLYEKFYEDHNFTYVSAEPVDTRDVAGTNKCMLHLDKDGDTLRVTSVLDPVLKGSAGNAVHLLNLLFGLHERTGLELIASSD